jgi:hypothetical protein
MIKYPSFLVVFLMIFTAVSLYQIKHFITKKEIELAETNNLKRPDRLEQIAKNKLNMKGILPIDIWNLKDLVDATKTFNESGS